ncbi:hypothetical protein BD779DRAFT_1483317 [Infundibulicybe gibba]|nr:hypothetical protein BD779DRAFT_1483317 [Infundibulicybe gibba]
MSAKRKKSRSVADGDRAETDPPKGIWASHCNNIFDISPGGSARPETASSNRVREGRVVQEVWVNMNEVEVPESRARWYRVSRVTSVTSIGNAMAGIQAEDDRQGTELYLTHVPAASNEVRKRDNPRIMTSYFNHGSSDGWVWDYRWDRCGVLMPKIAHLRFPDEQATETMAKAGGVRGCGELACKRIDGLMYTTPIESEVQL